MKKQNRIFQAGLILVLTLLCLFIIFPFWLLLSTSLTSAEVIAKGYQLIPNPVDFESYKFVFQNPDEILQAYKITFIFSVAYMVLSVLMMAMCAYPLARQKLKGRSIISFYLYFTSLFSGGLVPTYLLLVTTFGLKNNILIYIIVGLISPWYVFMMRTFFQGIPEAIVESATIDGASEYTIFFKMILPLSKPVIASIALFMFLAKWNDWNTALIYITDEKLYSLQYLLQSIMKEAEMAKQMQQMGIDNVRIDVPDETVQMAMAVVVAGPALFVFPFFQKYFVKGLTVGSVKG